MRTNEGITHASLLEKPLLHAYYIEKGAPLFFLCVAGPAYNRENLCSRNQERNNHDSIFFKHLPDLA